MQIDFECSGGLANLQLRYHADTAALPRELAEELLRLVESSQVFDLREGALAPKSAGPPDVFIYRLSLQEGARKKSLSCNDVSAPASLHPLLALLRKLALKQGRKGR